MEQTRALNALQPYLALSKSATSPRAAADVITQATSAPHTYVFAELLSTPSVQNLRTSSEEPHASHYKLLEIFAWGTTADYKANATTLPSLNASQKHKLDILTLLTLASTTPSSSNLTYGHLTTSLNLSSPRELEQLVTDAIYSSLLTGTLDPKNQLVSISSVAPLRDLAPGSVVAMVSELGAWSQRCHSVLSDLEAEIDRVKAEAAERRAWEVVKESQIERAEKGYSGGPKRGGDGGVPGGLGSRGPSQNQSARFEEQDEGDEMDVDDAPGGKARGKGRLGGLRKR